MSDLKPLVSIIIPVYNDIERLVYCLKALEEQTYPKDRYEVIVVDNGSDESIEMFVLSFPQAKFAREMKPGSYAARNVGIDMASGEILGFTDSDCIPAPDWIANGVAAMQSAPEMGFVGGQVELILKNPGRPSFIERQQVFRSFDQRRFVEELHFSVAANMFTSKKVIEKVGRFNRELKSLGDVDWGQRARLTGYKQLYGEDVIVRHPTRKTLRSLFKKRKRVMGGIFLAKRLNCYWGIGFQKIEHAACSPIYIIKRNWSKGNLDGYNFKEKALFIMFVYLMDWVGILERLRLRFGGEPFRS